MTILATPGWADYELIDSGNGFRFERFGKYKLVRPDPQIIWKPLLGKKDWDQADAVFENERWVNKNNVPAKWLMKFENLSFWAELSPFKHTGVFPEQSLQWQWMEKKIKDANRPLNVLNLFAYTGIASLVAAAAGAKVTHVDASRPTIGWARENQTASKLAEKPIRWILDDCLKFVQRETNRGVKYDGIIMDPPIYGHGPNGERWNFSESFPQLLDACRKVLSEKPVFVIINAYAISSSALMLENMLKDFTKGLGGEIEVGELALQEKTSDRLLSTGIFSRWTNMV